MATGRADFWYGRPFIVVDVPVDGDSEDAPTANWAYNHAANPSAHHVRYGDAEAVLAMGSIGNINPLNHNRYSGGEAQEAMGVLADYNPMNHNRYADSEAVTAMGAKANANPLNHDRHTAAQIQADAWPVYIDRGDPSVDDIAVASLTTDAAWHDLDLSAWVPAGAIAALIRVYAQATTANAIFFLRKNGNTGFANSGVIVTQVANQRNIMSLVVSLDNNQVCEYYAANVSWTTLSLTVRGWFV